MVRLCPLAGSGFSCNSDVETTNVTEGRKMEFVLVRYAPDLQGCINVGVVLFERAGDTLNFAQARFTKNMQRILTWDPDADIEVLQSLFFHIENKIENASETERMLELVRSEFSNAIQLSDAKGIVVSGNPEDELLILASIYLPPEPTQA